MEKSIQEINPDFNQRKARQRNQAMIGNQSMFIHGQRNSVDRIEFQHVQVSLLYELSIL